MEYAKSVLAGGAGSLCAVVVYVIVLIANAPRSPGAGEVGLDILGVSRTPMFWLVVILGFVLGVVVLRWFQSLFSA